LFALALFLWAGSIATRGDAADLTRSAPTQVMSKRPLLLTRTTVGTNPDNDSQKAKK